jgi:succinoglycan biosynthesis protein ExoO
VVLATYQRPELVVASVRSLAEQTLAPSEIIVVDDCSGDATLEVLTELQREIPQLRVASMPTNSGASAALNHAFSLATGDYVAVADDDDVCSPRRLEWSVELIERTGADMVGGQVVGILWGPLRFATSRFPTDATAIAQRIASGFDPLPHITMMLRRTSIERFGDYIDLARAADLEFMLRWAHRGARIEVSPEVFATYRFRREFFDVDTQVRWMILTAYGRELALRGPDEAPMLTFDEWFLRQPLGPARREARSRVARLIARLAVGTVFRRS